PNVAIMCGDWSQGSVMELIPHCRGLLSSERYTGDFVGIRQLRLAAQKHHVHLDLKRFRRVAYSILPSVCFGFRPSFEVRFLLEAKAAQTCTFSLAVRKPYVASHLSTDAITMYFVRFLEHAACFPDAVGLELDPLGQHRWEETRC